MRIVLVSCVKLKKSEKSEAQDLYISPLFKKMRKYAEQNGDGWFILSAKHGLVCPDEDIEPYEQTLNKMPKQDRIFWANRVAHLIGSVHLPDETKIVFLAGARYREFLEPLLKEMGYKVEVPMQGMQLGEQLSWLNGAIR